MGKNELTDILDETERLRRQRLEPVEPLPPTQSAAPRAPEGVPVQPVGGAPAPPEPQQDPGPPRLIGVDLVRGGVVSNIGDFPLDDREKKEVITICLRALARSMRATFATVAGNHGIEPPKRTGLIAMADFPKAPDAPPEVS